jgi:hypothetical protein
MIILSTEQVVIYDVDDKTLTEKIEQKQMVSV